MFGKINIRFKRTPLMGHKTLLFPLGLLKIVFASYSKIAKDSIKNKTILKDIFKSFFVNFGASFSSCPPGYPPTNFGSL